MPDTAKRLKQLLHGDELAFLMEAHNGLSAKVVEESGFAGIWASGLTISTALGVRDANEASWTQVLDVVEFMADAVDIPILLDGDTGYGNFNSVRRLVRKLCQRGVAGVCLEDKLFPKANSFLDKHQELAARQEFAGKIQAAKDSQTDPDFCVVARTEALIVGAGLDEALRRASAYAEAGADAVLVHSKRPDAREILDFMSRWDRRCPVIIVPTTYHATPCAAFRRAGIAMVIWANHNLRASLQAMRDVSRQILERQSIAEAEPAIASVRALFEIVDTDELTRAERRYLPAAVSDPALA